MERHLHTPAWPQPGPDLRFVLTSTPTPFLASAMLPQDRLSAAEAQQAELEYDMSDKSASLREATEQLAELKRQLAESRAAAEAASTKAEAAAAELEQSHARAMGLATALAELEGELEGRKEEAAAQEEALAAARAETEAQRAEAEAQRAEVESARQALAAVQQGTLLEKEQQVGGQGWMVWWVGMKVWWMCKNGAAGHSKPEWRRVEAPQLLLSCDFWHTQAFPPLPPHNRSSWAAPSWRSCAPSWQSRRRRRPSCGPSWRRGTASCGRPRQPWPLRWQRQRSRWGGVESGALWCWGETGNVVAWAVQQLGSC